MKRFGLVATLIGFFANFGLFLTKLYVGISTNSLAIYCDAINNLGDTFSCAIVVLGFVLIRRTSENKSNRIQSLFTFVISIVIAISGIYFVYNGADRILYPLPVSYTVKYAIIIILTVFAKILMGIMYAIFNKKEKSTMLKALVLDSFLDCLVTIFALMSLFLIGKINFAVDGIFAIIAGGIITVTAIKNIINEGKYLVNN